MRSTVRNQKRKQLGAGAKALFGVSIVLAALALTVWFSEAVVKAGVLTGSLFGALTTSFTSRWRDSKFWIVVAFLFTVHLIAVCAVIDRMAALNLYSLVIIGFAEGVIMIILLFVTGQRADS